jgi:hypothetical protein
MGETIVKLKSLLMVCVAAGAAFAVTAQAADKPAAKSSAKGAAAAYKAPRTVNGQPDLQNTWTNVSLTQLERPATYGTRKTLT